MIMPISTTGKIFFGALAGYVGVNILNKFLEKNTESPQEKPGPVDGLAPMRAMMNAGDYMGFVAECRRIDSKMSVHDMTLLWEGLKH